MAICVAVPHPRSLHPDPPIGRSQLEEEKLKTDPEEFSKQFISGDFSKSPLEQLLPLAQDIYLPILVSAPALCTAVVCAHPTTGLHVTTSVPLARQADQSIGEGGGWALYLGVDIAEQSQPDCRVLRGGALQMDLWEEDVVPEVIVQEVKEKAAGFLACLTRVIGLSKGQTVLPAPVTVDTQNDAVLQDPEARKAPCASCPMRSHCATHCGVLLRD